MSKTNNFIFWGLYAIAWIIFVGLSIEAGGLIVNFVFHLCNPELIQNLYQKVDLTQMYKESRFEFFSIYSFILIISILKAVLFYTVITLMHKMNLSKPFSTFVAKKISMISYYSLSIGLLSYIAKQVVENLNDHSFVPANLNQFLADSEGFIFMGAVIHIIAQIFKRGVELQEENDLTV
ncbi:DUF2975 domain-containing protein [Epilithonimonas zeae]|uniref:DUF2975 domain-containing protein n=1 Tax=Epilithonimonas zeae TaxID=1416779 RepID=UPI00200D3820|nr:DUF2975 domain-containing protein [Epilithonimonas zeae]UQB70114.1 DUF2975 domain-containing protein [Epilithonimonas zeae]